MKRPMGTSMMRTMRGNTATSRADRSRLPFHSTCQFTCAAHAPDAVSAYSVSATLAACPPCRLASL